MAPTRPNKKSKKRNENQTASPRALLELAAAQLEQGDLETALSAAQNALEATGEGGDFELRALDLLGHIYVEVGEIEDARACFTRAVHLDPDGTLDEKIGGGPEKFLWLAQLSEDGGQDSVRWFERGASALRSQIQVLADLPKRTAEQEALLEEKKRKLAGTLCGVAEVYMTDLSWEADAEQRCEALVTEATLVAPGLAESWQTVANVRISQARVEDARAALTRSMEIWAGLPTTHPDVPDFPARVSLTRLLLEVEMEKEALDVVERLVGDDDESVEAWYLGGWGQYISGEKVKQQVKEKKAEADEEEEEWKTPWASARRWLRQCLRLFEQQEYEDDRLGDHAKELLASIDKELGPAPENDDDDDDDDAWEDANDSGEDEEMAG
ncbi:TPR domain-containing protein [Sodiomyces alkalinus F11]|uniref:TPR domain-containing protein n=1 Tax=Sodiomyces alkalinus (strain CBS 110278 / VKM F-3762 / F11) TaxID=1314773 RepID=A0A3N2PR54_SODAK|nr:TPR domain-containing protein [Sodiomyces alkalinus F11]ROT36991.1 TPR domain-containing protein [Sodiomyces alkalinus F11]